MKDVLFYPDFYVVGAPKCGTTSLYEYLRQHPDIFLPKIKEPHYFGEDLHWRKRVIARESYESLYSNVPSSKRAGDMSVFYLVSQTAAVEIAKVRPDAKIIVMLRDPLSMLPSLHRQALKTGDEVYTNLISAIEAEPARAAGLIDIDMENPGVMQMLYYSQIAQYAEQVQRYFRVFGRENVHVILFEDFVGDTVGSVRAAFQHIGVDPTFTPTIALHNEGASIRHVTLWRLIKHPPRGVRRLWRKILPGVIRGHILHKAGRLVMSKGKAPEMSPALRSMIIDMYREDVAKLEVLIQRDLSGWLEGEVGRRNGGRSFD